MHKKFERNQTKIKIGCQSGRKVVTHNSKSDLPLIYLLRYVATGDKTSEVENSYQNKSPMQNGYFERIHSGEKVVLN